ncbi:MAG TPA: CCA tRNA nucleotidyltransferase [Geminicoccaceae bacterium]|nr:CCA tRNA nucleotidyltransferase [Geminicoccaceae bacterium]
MRRKLRPLAGQAWLSAPDSRRVLRALAAGGRPVRFVGGCVRDGLLGRDRAGRDLDLATPEAPERVIDLLAAAGLKAIPTGLAHGTVTALADGRRFEITTLRRDVRTDGRHAIVAFTDDFAADAARRDFTINAMSCDPDGRLFDYFGGRADLAAGRVRFVGVAAQRIAEDFLRILRFFRFLAHYGRLPADTEALAACAAAAPEIARLSGERIQVEMRELLAAENPLPALALMRQTGVLAQVVPGTPAEDRLARLLALAPAADWLLRLAALLRGEAAEAVAQVASRWRLSSRDAERLLALSQDPLPPLVATPAARRRALHRLGAGRYADLARLAAAETGADDAGAMLAEALCEAARWRPKTLPISGHDVLALGVPAGPAVGKLLAEVEDWWAAQDFAPDRAACLAEARALLHASGHVRSGRGTTPRTPGDGASP